MAGCCEYGSLMKKGGEFRDQLSDCWILKYSCTAFGQYSVPLVVHSGYASETKPSVCYYVQYFSVQK